MSSAADTACSHCHLPIRGFGHDRRVRGEERRFCCYGCCLAFQVAHGEGEESEAAWLLVRLGVGAFLAMNIMLFSLLLYSGTLGDGDAEIIVMVHVILWALATACMLVLGSPLFREAGRAALRGRLTAASLISLGAGAAYAYSALAVMAGGDEVYFDTATMLLVLYTLGRLLEASGRARAMRDLAPMLEAERERVTLLDGAVERQCLARDVAAGMHVLVRPGERIAVDGVVVDGSSWTDEAVITGENRPVAKAHGSIVLAGSINHAGSLVVRATGAGTATRWARISASVRAALSRPGEVQRLADRIAGAFVPAVLLLAALAAVWWAQHMPLDDALLIGLAVLVVACPCGVGLAGALATTLGIGRLARRGCLVRGGQIVELLAAVRAVAFDKTGTVTLGTATVTSVITDGTVTEEVLRRAAGVERASEHPLARAVVNAAAERGIDAPLARQAAAVPGRGIRGDADGLAVLVGSPEWLAAEGYRMPAVLGRRQREAASGGDTLIHVGWAGIVRAAVTVGEALRPEAPVVVDGLRRLGLHTVLLTGDRQESAARIAHRLGVDGWEASLSPEAKNQSLGRLRARFGPVAMVGDGINDGPVLAGADVGIAVGTATDLARETADFVLPESGLGLLPWTIRLSRAVRRTILTNLAWAFGYNAIGLALAVSGHLQPLFAAALMAGSSLLVVLNSLRLERFPEPEHAADLATTETAGYGAGPRTAPRLAG